MERKGKLFGSFRFGACDLRVEVQGSGSLEVRTFEILSKKDLLYI